MGAGVPHIDWAVHLANVFIALGANLLAQSALLAGTGLLVAWVLRHRGAALRSAILRVTLAAILLCPIISLGLKSAGVRGLTFSLPYATTQLIDVPAPSGVPAPILSESDIRPFPKPLGDLAAIPNLQSDAATTPAMSSDQVPVSVSRTSATPRATRLGLLYISLTGFWLVASGLLLLRLLIAYARMWRIRSLAKEAPSTLCAACKRLAGDMHVTPPLLLISALAKSPCLIGFLRPAVLLPESYAAAGPLVSREVIMHELAHMARRDCVWNLLGRVAGSILFLQPLVWRLTRRLEDASDDVADDYVVQEGMDRRHYANLLTDIAESFQRAPLESLVGVGVFYGSSLERRVDRILDTTRSLSVRIGVRAAVVIIAVALCATFATGLVGAGSSHIAAAAARFETGLAYRLEGDGYTESAQYQEALDAYLAAVDVFESLTLDFPEEAEYQSEHALSENGLGAALRLLGRHEEAQEATRSAVARMEALVDSSPADPDLLNTLVQAYRGRGLALTYAAKGIEGEQAYRQALEIADGLVATFPDVPEYRYELARTYQNISYLLRQQERGQEAAKARRQMVAHLERLVADFPDEPLYHRRLAEGLRYLALMVSDDKGRDPQLMKEAVRRWQETVELAPMKPGYRKSLASSCDVLAETLVARERHDEAVQAYEQTIALLEGHLSTIPDGRTDLIGLMAKLRDLLETVGRVEEAEEVRNRAETYRQELLAGSVDHLLIENRLVGMPFGDPTRAGRVRYRVRIGSPGEYRLYVRLDGHDGRSDLLCAWIDELGDGSGGSVADAYGYAAYADADFGTGSWNCPAYFETNVGEEPTNAVWSIPAPGVYTVGFAMMEDGVAIDAFILQRSDLPPPSGYGPEESRMSPEGAFMESNGTLVVEAEHFTSRTSRQANWLVVPDEDPGDVAHQNFRGTGYIQALPDTIPTEEQTLANLTLAIESDPNDTEALTQRGRAYVLLEQWNKALADLSKAIELQPDDVNAWHHLGYTYNGLEQWDKALAAFSKGIELQPDHVPAWAWQHLGYTYNGLEQWDKALAAFSKAIELQPEYVADVWRDRGHAYMGLEQWDKALADFSKAIELQPDHPHAREQRDYAYQQLQLKRQEAESLILGTQIARTERD